MNLQLTLARTALTTAAALDAEWRARTDAGRDDLARFTPFMPFPRPDFIALVAEALPEVTGDQFLSVGSGPGSELLLAEAVFGLNVQGIERVPEYVAAARQRGLVVTEADALGWDGYGQFDLVFFNRVFSDQALEEQLEKHVWDSMKSGAVVIAANLVNEPPLSWYPVLDDREVRRWISQKPGS